jgi:uncharacterized protein
LEGLGIDKAGRVADVSGVGRSRSSALSINRRIILFILGLVTALPILASTWGGISALFKGGSAPVAISEAQAGPVDRIDLITKSGPHRFSIEVVADEASRAQGLMFRQSMADDHGMLFDFRREQPASFWMKNTYIPLDMIFIRADGTVVNIAEDTVPMSEAAVNSSAPVRFVLEVNAGIARKIGLKAGDRAVHQYMKAYGG